MKAAEILNTYFGYTSFRPTQEKIVRATLSGKDVLALLPTGGGKSICFQVPALGKPGICLVVTPLIALMLDQVKNLQQKGITAVALHSGLKYKELDNCLQRMVNKHYKFVYISPERLVSKAFLSYAVNLDISLIAIDEAHCISQWGYDFRPSYLRISEFTEQFHEANVIALTATATPRVQKDICDKLKLRSPVQMKDSFVRKNLEYHVIHDENKMDRIQRLVKKLGGTGLIYVNTRKKTAEVAQQLISGGDSADFYHAGLDSETRAAKQENWKSDKTRIMVATNAFGMGIDKPNVRFVIHYEKPQSLEAYYQEAGRAGRDGKPCHGILLWHESDMLEDDIKIKQKYPEYSEIDRIYQLLCNYLNIALNSGESITYEVDIQDFCKRYELSVTHVHSCLNNIQSQGVLSISDASLLSSSIKIQADYKELYKIQLKYPEVDELMKVILRSYGGVFDQYVSISEYEIGTRLNKPDAWIYNILDRLAANSIIDFRKKSDSTLIHFHVNRSRTVHLDRKQMNVLKERYKSQIQSVNDYIQKSTVCRTAVLVRYFGEYGSENCGVCDVCRSGAASKPGKKEYQLLYQTILQEITANNLTVTELVKRFPDEQTAEFENLLKWMLDNGIVQFNNQNRLICSAKESY